MDNLEIKNRALSSLLKDIKRKKYNYEHPLQRESGQWNRRQMSKLIDSVIRFYPIFPILIAKGEDGEKDGIIDGKQRMTIIPSYANNEFALSKDLEPVVIDGESYEIAGKKYKQLDEVIRDRFDEREIQLYVMTKVTEKDIREIFARINSGKNLNNAQLRPTIETPELMNIVCELAAHPFFGKVVSKTMVKNASNRDMVREVLMLTEMSDEYDFGSFRTKDIDAFVRYYNEHINHGKIDIVRQALDRLDESFEEIKLNKTSLPLVIYGMYEVVKDNKPVDSYVGWLRQFLENYDNNTEYLTYCQSGTSSADNVKGRLNYFRTAIQNM